MSSISKKNYRIAAVPLAAALFACLMFGVATARQISLSSINPPVIMAPNFSTTGEYNVRWAEGWRTDYTYTVEERAPNGTWSRLYTRTDRVSIDPDNSTQGDWGYRAIACYQLPPEDSQTPAPPLCSEWSPVKTVGVYFPPSKPVVSALSSPNVTGTYTISWAASTGIVTKYNLWERRGTQWFLVSRPASANLTRSHTFTNKADGSFDYKVEACNLAGCGAQSLSVSISVRKTPTIPGNFQGTYSATTGSVSFTWDRSTETVDQYELIRRKNVEGAQYEVVARPSSNSFSLGGGHSDGSYNFRVRACNGTCSESTSARTINILKIPTAPGAVTVPAQSNSGSFRLSWSASHETVESYKIYKRRQSSECSSSEEYCHIGTTGSTDFAFQDQANGTYSYQVKACNQSGCGPAAASGSIVVAKTAAGVRDAEPVILPRPAGQYIGTLEETEGQMGGRATYQVAVPLPPGRNGMTPNVSLQYTSGGGDSDAGVGWSLDTGAGAIYRCSSIKATDQLNRVFNGSSKDKLCLDGQHLMLQRGSYGVMGSTYLTETDTFSTIELLGGGSHEFDSHFKVSHKDGTHSIYASVLAPTRQGRSGSYPVQWRLTRRVDTSGNSIDFQYDSSASENLVTRISYTGHNGTHGTRAITFEYGPRSAQAASYDHAGHLTLRTKILRGISTWTGSTQAGHVALRHGTSESSGRDLLEGVRLCDTSLCQKYYQETRFDYAQGSSQFTNVTYLEGELSNLEDVGDIDGDGQPDLVLTAATSRDAANQPVELRLSSRTEAVPLSDWLNSGLKLDLASFTSGRSKRADFNGDGRSDLYRIKDAKLEVSVWNNTSTSFDVWQTNLSLPGVVVIKAVGDYDADGDVDLHFSQRVGTAWNEGITFNCTPEGASGFIQFCGIYNVPSGAGEAAGDLNGDQLVDFQTLGDINVAVKVRFGSRSTAGTYELAEPFNLADLGGPLNYVGRAVYRLDVNGDTLQDVYIRGVNGANALYINTGGRFLGVSMPNISLADEHLFNGLVVMDYDQDGTDELLVPAQLMQNYCYTSFQGGGDDSVDRTICNTGAHTFDNTPGYELADRGVYRYDVIKFRYQSGQFTLQRTASSLSGVFSIATACDANSDGLIDLCQRKQPTYDHNWEVSGDWQGSDWGTYASLRVPHAQGYTRDIMVAATNGLGSQHVWQFSPLSGSGAASCTYDASRPFYTYDRDEDVPGTYNLNAPSLVVARHGVTNGIGSLNNECYRYKNAMFSSGGRGFQGFTAIAVDENLGDGHDTTTLTTYYARFPLTGKVQSVEKRMLADNVAARPISKTIYSWVADRDSTGVYRTILDGQIQETSDVDSGSRGVVGRVTTVFTATAEDIRAGNFSGEIVIQETLDGSGTTLVWNQKRIINSYDYSVRGTGWLNKLDKVTTVTSPTSYHASLGDVPAENNPEHTYVETYTYTGDNRRLVESVSRQASVPEQAITEVYGYDKYGNVVSVTLSAPAYAARTTSTEFEQEGYFPFAITDAAGFTSLYAYAPTHGQVTDIALANGTTTTFDYDFAGQLISSEATPGTRLDVISQQCNDCGLAVYKRTKVQDGRQSEVEYIDAVGRIVRVDQSGYAGDVITRKKSFDRRGRLIWESQPSTDGVEHRIEYSDYDSMGRFGKKEVSREGHRIAKQVWLYRHTGLLTEIKLPGEEVWTSRTYDAQGNLLNVVDGKGVPVSYRYDGSGNKILTLNSNGSTVRASYDASGRRVAVWEPNSSTSSSPSQALYYNGLGEIVRTQSSTGDSVTTEYDALGRTTLRKVNGVVVSRWSYDNGGSRPHTLTSMETGDTNGDQAPDYLRVYTYDNSSRLVRTSTSIGDYPAMQSEYAYDNYYNRLKARRFPSGDIVAFGYDQYGIPMSSSSVWSSPTAPDGSQSDQDLHVVLDADASGAATRVLYGNGAVSAYSRMPSTGLTTESNHISPNGESLSHHTYSYDDARGNLTSRHNVISGVTESFEYDTLNRVELSVVSSSGSTLRSVDYEYDSSGNLIRKSDVASTYIYGSTDRSQNRAGPNAVREIRNGDGSILGSYSYDDAGNMIASNGKTVTYDAFNKPVQINEASGITKFGYAPDLNVAWRVDGSKVTLFDDGYEVTIQSGAVIAERIHATPFAVIEKRSGARNVRFLHYDKFGSLVLATNESGVATEAHGFDAFGKPLAGSWSENGALLHADTSAGDRLNTSGFTGHEHLDAHRLVHMGGRLYDPVLGRFMSVDPYTQLHGGSQAENSYSYVLNNPLSNTDPSGYACGGVCASADYEYSNSLLISTGVRPQWLSGREMALARFEVEEEDFRQKIRDIESLIAARSVYSKGTYDERQRDETVLVAGKVPGVPIDFADRLFAKNWIRNTEQQIHWSKRRYEQFNGKAITGSIKTFAEVGHGIVLSLPMPSSAAGVVSATPGLVRGGIGYASKLKSWVGGGEVTGHATSLFTLSQAETPLDYVAGVAGVAGAFGVLKPLTGDVVAGVTGFAACQAKNGGGPHCAVDAMVSGSATALKGFARAQTIHYKSTIPLPNRLQTEAKIAIPTDIFGAAWGVVGEDAMK